MNKKYKKGKIEYDKTLGEINYIKYEVKSQKREKK